MKTLNIIVEFYQSLHESLGIGLYIILGFATIITVVSMWRLFEHAGKPGWASLVPGYNVLVFLEMIGRPASHIFLFLIPIYGQLYMIPKVFIEMCQSFGKRSIVDYVCVVLLNGLYILNLGMSYDTKYEGPAYGKSKPEGSKSLSPQMA